MAIHVENVFSNLEIGTGVQEAIRFHLPTDRFSVPVSVWYGDITQVPAQTVILPCRESLLARSQVIAKVGDRVFREETDSTTQTRYQKLRFDSLREAGLYETEVIRLEEGSCGTISEVVLVNDTPKETYVPRYISDSSYDELMRYESSQNTPLTLAVVIGTQNALGVANARSNIIAIPGDFGMEEGYFKTGEHPWRAIIEGVLWRADVPKVDRIPQIAIVNPEREPTLQMAIDACRLLQRTILPQVIR